LASHNSVHAAPPGNHSDAPQGLVANVRWGVTWGLRMAMLFCAWIGILVVLNWSFTLPVRSNHHVNAFAVVALYVGGGIIAGAIVGLLRPLERTMAGAMLTGFVAALPVFAGGSLLLNSLSNWDITNTIVTLAGAGTLGPMMGAYLRADTDEDERKRKTGQEQEGTSRGGHDVKQ